MDDLNNIPNSKILLVESNQDEKQYFNDVVRKKYPSAVIEVVENSFEAIQILQKGKWQVVVIEENAEPMNANQTTDYIRQELKTDIPIFVSSIQEHSSEEYICKPFTEESLQKFLNHSPKNLVDEEPLYSLDYLKKISGDNTEFIVDSIEIFKSSVKQQLKELDIASKEHDDEKASKIAHNIKPSFEMIDNKEGTEICNKLTYDLGNNELSSLVHRLKVVFERIIQQLQRDFAPKKI